MWLYNVGTIRWEKRHVLMDDWDHWLELTPRAYPSTASVLMGLCFLVVKKL